MRFTPEMEEVLADAWNKDNGKEVTFFLTVDGIKNVYKSLANHVLRSFDGKYLVLVFDNKDLFVAEFAQDHKENPPFVTFLGGRDEPKRYLVTNE